MVKFSPEIIERINNSVDAHKRIQAQSTGASVSFHEKLAVLTAGSIALAVSGSGALYQKPLTDIILTHRLFYSLTISVVCLWLSLVASLLHNFLESYALHLDSRVGFIESTVNLFEVVLDMDEIKQMPGNISQVQEFVESRLQQGQQEDVLRAAFIRKWEMPISTIAVSLFALGYLSVVGYVFILARNVH
jgi:hypothetical protein